MYHGLLYSSATQIKLLVAVAVVYSHIWYLKGGVLGQDPGPRFNIYVYPEDVFEMVADRHAAYLFHSERSQRRLMLIETHPRLWSQQPADSYDPSPTHTEGTWVEKTLFL